MLPLSGYTFPGIRFDTENHCFHQPLIAALMQFTFTIGAEKSFHELEVNVGSSKTLFLVRLGGFSLSLAPRCRWYCFWHWHRLGRESLSWGAHHAGTVELGPLEMTWQVPKWACLGSRSGA